MKTIIMLLVLWSTALLADTGGWQGSVAIIFKKNIPCREAQQIVSPFRVSLKCVEEGRPNENERIYGGHYYGTAPVAEEMARLSKHPKVSVASHRPRYSLDGQ